MPLCYLESTYLDQSRIDINEEELWEVFERIVVHGNSVIWLRCSDWGALTIGVGKPLGFVEYMNSDGTLPYLVASERQEKSDGGKLIEFDAGGTPTPIPEDYCLPIEKVVEITRFFIREKRLPGFVNWIEV